ncbi:BglG family transcription antiterminator [Lactobacillus corticis]|uniref:Sorbitol operon transcription regulator n=1 Tax=Lactobacillus corticis TaxID=2201249 RepID=A0A916QKZ9_9LACO|nr:HTH domain-containing protein [Lactobacillus corticis]GFZ27411.1 sorbitol operon transcription regulator [Lactobacillus corticis]
MNNALFSIVKLLIENGPLTTDEIAFYENVSTRTITNRIGDLQNILDPVAEIERRGNTYSLVIHDYARFVKLESSFLKEKLDLNDPETRRAYISLELIKHIDYVSYDELADLTLLDKRAISKYLKEIEVYFSKYGVKIDVRPRKGLKLEISQPWMILTCVRNIFANNPKFMDFEKLEAYKKQLNNCQLSVHLRKSIAHNLLALDFVRIYRGKVQKFNPNFTPLWDMEELNTVDKAIRQIFPDIENGEMEFVLSPLNLEKNKFLDSSRTNQKFEELHQLVIDFINQTLRGYNIRPEGFYEKIKWHLLFLVNRSLVQEPVTDVLPNNIAEKYPISLDAVLKLKKRIENNYDVTVSSKEIDYLVIYVEMLLQDADIERNHKIINIALIGNMRHSVVEFIEAELKRVFPDYQLDKYSSVDELHKTGKKYAFIISQFPFRYEDTPVVSINSIFKKNVISKIAAVTEISRSIDEGRLLVTIDHLAEPNYTKAVVQLIEKQIKCGYVDRSFLDAIKARETQNVVHNRIAMPHASDSSGRKRVLLSFGVPDKKMSFNNLPVDLIALIAIPDKIDDDLVEVASQVYDLIPMISQDPTLFENITQYQSERPFIQILEGV